MDNPDLLWKLAAKFWMESQPFLSEIMVRGLTPAITTEFSTYSNNWIPVWKGQGLAWLSSSASSRYMAAEFGWNLKGRGKAPHFISPFLIAETSECCAADNLLRRSLIQQGV